MRARCKRQIDELDMLGFLAADAFGPGTLLHHEDANAVGKRVQTPASRADKAIKAADKVQRDAIRLAKGRAEKVAAAEAAGRAARDKALGKSLDLQLEGCRFLASGGKKRKAAQAPTAAPKAEHAAQKPRVVQRSRKGSRGASGGSGS